MYCKLPEAMFTTVTYFVPDGYTTDVEHVIYSMFLMFLLKYKNMFLCFYCKIYVFYNYGQSRLKADPLVA